MTTHRHPPVPPASPPSTASGPTRCCSASPASTSRSSATARGVVRSDNGFLGIEVDATFDELPEPDVVVFPGGVGTRALMHDERVLDWVRHGPRDDDVHDVGVHRLARARRRRAARRAHGDDALERRCDVLAEARRHRRSSERVVEHLDRRIITAAGVSSGIDMALRLVELLVDRTAAEAAQLMIEYDPQPPFDAGALAKAGDDVMTRVIEYAAVRQ